MIIPPERLTMEVLRGLAEAFINREGTDYGEHELSLDEKVEALIPQVLSGEVLITFDEDSQTANLIPKEDYGAAQ